MNTVTVYACPSVPMDSIECTIEYDPAVVEAFLHPPNSGQEWAAMARSVTKRYCDGGAPH